MSSGRPSLRLRRSCFRITHTPVPVPGAISAGAWCTMYSTPDMLLRNSSKRSRVSSTGNMVWLCSAWL